MTNDKQRKEQKKNKQTTNIESAEKRRVEQYQYMHTSLLFLRQQQTANSKQ